MRKAYDTILSDYVDAETAAHSYGFEPYRYECPNCWEEVHLCAVDSNEQITHFRHRNGNNNAACELYYGNRSTIISRALANRRNRDRVEFVFSSDTKLFSVGVKFSLEEISVCEKIGVCLYLKSAYNNEPFVNVPINRRRFIPDVTEMIPLEKFSLNYYISSTNDPVHRRYVLFRTDGNGFAYPSFFKINSDIDESYRAKLVQSDTLYTNTTYLAVFSQAFDRSVFSNDVTIRKDFKFRTMERNFTGVVIEIPKKAPRIVEQLKSWKYRLEDNETMTLLWPPSPRIDNSFSVYRDKVFMFSSFDMHAHGTINTVAEDIYREGQGVTKVLINDRIKVYKKNVEIILDKCKRELIEYEKIAVQYETSKKYVASDNESFLFNCYGVTKISKGMSIIMTPSSKVNHYTSGYLDRVISAIDCSESWDGERLLHDILMHYKRTEEFSWNAYDIQSISPIAYSYLCICEKTGRINAVAKCFIRAGRI